MQMVASAKMRKAQQAALAGRPYASLMNEVLAAATAGAGEFQHPLTEKREIKKRALIIISTDKGLCGALNTNLLREAAKAHSPTTVYVVAGRKAAQWVARLKRELVAEFSYKDAPEFAEARAISKFAQELFLSGQADAVDVVFTNYVNTLTQKAELRSLLPLGRLQKLEADLRGNGSAEEIQSSTSREFGFEPAAPQLLGNLLPHYLNYQVYQMLLEAKASEHSARMVAMKSATDNAKQLIKDLTLEYNKLRQANITKELLEITSAAMAMGN
jgi:F-type H+-transporting ATPase subunit gamma